MFSFVVPLPSVVVVEPPLVEVGLAVEVDAPVRDAAPVNIVSIMQDHEHQDRGRAGLVCKDMDRD